jgi:hypothetical protein
VTGRTGFFNDATRFLETGADNFSVCNSQPRVALGAGIGLLLSSRLINAKLLDGYEYDVGDAELPFLMGGLTAVPLALGVIGKKSAIKPAA